MLILFGNINSLSGGKEGMWTMNLYWDVITVTGVKLYINYMYISFIYVLHNCFGVGFIQTNSSVFPQFKGPKDPQGQEKRVLIV